MFHQSWDGQQWQADWDGHGGPSGGFQSPLSAVSWGVKRLDIFGIGSDGAMWHLSFDANESNYGWQSQWDSLGGGPFVTPPVAVSWGPDRLDVFSMKNDDLVYHIGWDGSAWSDWVSIGGPSSGSPTPQSVPPPSSSQPSPVQSSPGSDIATTTVPNTSLTTATSTVTRHPRTSTVSSISFGPTSNAASHDTRLTARLIGDIVGPGILVVAAGLL